MGGVDGVLTVCCSKPLEGQKGAIYRQPIYLQEVKPFLLLFEALVHLVQFLLEQLDLLLVLLGPWALPLHDLDLDIRVIPIASEGDEARPHSLD